jgi:hypothetical protein
LGRLNHTMACDSSGVTEIMRKPGAGAKFVFSGGKIRSHSTSMNGRSHTIRISWIQLVKVSRKSLNFIANGVDR